MGVAASMATNKKTTKLETEAHSEAQRVFREKHYTKEMTANLKKLKAIRDGTPEKGMKCPHCEEYITLKIALPSWVKNQIEAIKAIARHLGGLQAERETKASAVADAAAEVSPLDKKLTSKDEAELDAYINNENSKMVS